MQWIYLYNFLHYAGDSISEVFSAVLLYNRGFDIVEILGFLGLKWGIMAFLTPLMPIVIKRLGYFRTEAISVAAMLMANLVLVVAPMESASVPILVVLLLLYGIAGAFTTPIQTTMKVMFIPEKMRGTVNGRLFAVRALAVMATSFVVGFFINESSLMITFIAATLIPSLVPLGILFQDAKRPIEYSYKASLGLVWRKSFRRYIPAFLLRSFMHIEKFLIPLYIFLVVGDLKVLSVYIILSTLAEMAAMLVFGTNFDKNRGQTLGVATFFRSLSSGFLIFRPLLESMPIFCQTFSRITGRGHDNIYQAFEQRLIKKSGLNPSICAAGMETTICFAEAVACIGFAILAVTLGHDILFVVFGCSIVAAWLIFLNLRKI